MSGPKKLRPTTVAGTPSPFVGHADLFRPDHHSHASLLHRAANGQRAEAARDSARLRLPRKHYRLADELCQLEVDRGAVELRRRRRLDQPSGAEDRDLVAHRQRLGLVVRDEDCGRPGARHRFEHGRARLGAQRGVEPRERLVEQYHRRVRREGAGQRHAPLLAAGQLARLAPRVAAVESHQLEGLVDPAASPALRPRQPEADVLGHRQVREERALLRDVPDRALVGGDVDTRARPRPPSRRR